MKRYRRLLGTFATGVALVLGSVGASAAPITQLGFVLDASGSVAPSDYNLLRNGLNAALAGLPTDGSVEITVVSYSSSASTVVSPTILDSTTLPTIQSAISTHAKSGGGTNTGGAITSATSLLTGSSIFGLSDTRSLINLATDGFPNSQLVAEAAAQAAFAAGIDALSIEAIGSGVASQFALNNLAQIAFPGPVTILPVNSTNIPNPTNGSFVIPVSDFNSLAPVLAAKVVASVTPTDPQVPLPATVLLFSTGLLGLGVVAMRRRNA